MVTLEFQDSLYVMLGIFGNQNIEDAVEQSVEVTLGSADMRFHWGKVFSDKPLISSSVSGIPLLRISFDGPTYFWDTSMFAIPQAGIIWFICIVLCILGNLLRITMIVNQVYN